MRKITEWLVAPATDQRCVAQIYLRVLGSIYALAFLSFAVQFEGLIGSHGVVPIASFLEAVASRFGLERFYWLPTLTWLNASDTALAFFCWGGFSAGVALMLGVFPRLAVFVCWVSYLSLVNAGDVFMRYQWESLLLEAGFLAIFLPARGAPSKLWVWLHRLLLFRLMFMSGVCKLASGDTTWRGLTALSFHYETQPLPTPLAWYVHQMPGWFHRASTFATLFIELGMPFLFLAPKRWRTAGFYLNTGLQCAIAATGNYTCFNFITLALGFFLIEDAQIFAGREVPIQDDRPRRWTRWITPTLGVYLGYLGLTYTAGAVGIPLPDPQWLVSPANRLHLVSGYGLFAVMTTERDELVLEGSNDGKDWEAYEFRYKPGDLRRAPPWVAPHQPRLDWQMWFASLGEFENQSWLQRMMEKLLRGEPAVLKLLGHNPFPDHPPQFLRVQRYRYHFTDWATGRREGTWWTRSFVGSYSPEIELSSQNSN